MSSLALHGGPSSVPLVRSFLFLDVQLIVTLAKVIRPGGVATAVTSIDPRPRVTAARMRLMP